MLIASSTAHQSNLFGTDLIEQLDPKDPLLQLAAVIPWQRFDQSFAKYYAQGIGRPSKPIRLMVGLLILKQLENLGLFAFDGWNLDFFSPNPPVQKLHSRLEYVLHSR
jgi:hypothetical protein